MARSAPCLLVRFAFSSVVATVFLLPVVSSGLVLSARYVWLFLLSSAYCAAFGPRQGVVCCDIAYGGRSHLLFSLVGSPPSVLFDIAPFSSSTAGPVIKTYPLRKRFGSSSGGSGGLLAPGFSRPGPLAHGAAHQNVLI